jgi:two-component system sensor histidine kinase KdpD
VGAALTRQAAVLKGHRVVTMISDDLPLSHVDGPLVEEVLSNLLENAARYTPRGSTVTIRAARAEAGMLIEVLDEGPGLPPGAERDVFRRFVRHRPPGDRQGTGLGLAICDTVVGLHGGRIGAENRTEGGARFWFTLPITAGAPAQFAGTSELPAESSRSSSGTQGVAT